MRKALKRALEQLVGMREREGAALVEVLAALAEELGQHAELLRASLGGEAERLQDRLAEKIAALCVRAGVSPPSPERVAQEVAVLVQRGDIEEELARLWQADRIGTHPDCVSAYGAYDLSGNVDEWTRSTRAWGYRMILKGGHWSFVLRKAPRLPQIGKAESTHLVKLGAVQVGHHLHVRRQEPAGRRVQGGHALVDGGQHARGVLAAQEQQGGRDCAPISPVLLAGGAVSGFAAAPPWPALLSICSHWW